MSAGRARRSGWLRKSLTRVWIILVILAHGIHPETISGADQEKVEIKEDALKNLEIIQALPNPFTMLDGTPVKSKEDWKNRHQEISELVQKYVYGPKPARPDNVAGSISDGVLKVTCGHEGRSIEFDVRIAYPESGEGPWPAIINLGGFPTLPPDILNESGIAILYFPNSAIGDQRNRQSRGKGLFYDLYGNDHPAGSLMAWAWGVSRLIDALETTPEAKIRTDRLGVTGCSRNGKGALVCGAFDERITLTIPTESGSGGASSWRVADAMLASGRKVQTARQIVTENTWMAPAFEEFGLHIEKLPVDQHLVAALCAPRALLMTENAAFEWLGPEACYTTGAAARTIWQALGIPHKMAFVQTSHGDHCRFKEVDELKAFCARFLLDQDQNTDTGYLKTDAGFDKDTSKWITWETPEL